MPGSQTITVHGTPWSRCLSTITSRGTRIKGCAASAEATTPNSSSISRDHRQEGLGIAFELRFADAWDRRELGLAAGFEARHLDQRRVVEDDIGRQRLAARELE